MTQETFEIKRDLAASYADGTDSWGTEPWEQDNLKPRNMPLHRKLMLTALELLAGMTGWFWIGASIAAIVFAGLALFGDYSWWNVLYALLAASGAKIIALVLLNTSQAPGAAR